MTNERTPREVFRHHAQALGGEDLEGIVSDYTEDAIFITPDGGVLRGKGRDPPGVHQAALGCPAGDVGPPHPDLGGRHPPPGMDADSEKAKVEDGIDTFVFRDGLIRVQTLRYTLQAKT